MDFDFSTALYLILGIIYFVFSGLKKKGKQGTNPPKRGKYSDPETVGPPPTSQRPTFEELLEEFTGQKTIQQPEPEVVAAPVVIPERPKPVAINPEHRKPKEYKPLVSFKEYDTEEDYNQDDYREMFSSLDDAKRAFIASEVFNRKY